MTNVATANLARRHSIFLALSVWCLFPIVAQTPEQDVARLLQQESRFAAVPPHVFDSLGWDLPDGGAAVRGLADAAPGGAFSPEELEKLPAQKLGYRARWHVHRFRYYNLAWDITALELTPVHDSRDLPVLAIIHGGSANWYEFFVDPLNRPGLGQYLAQKIPIVLITIPGSYKPGGWTQPCEQRAPEYLVGVRLRPREVELRNAVFTFQLVAEGVRQLLEKIEPERKLLIAGHSTGGEIQFMLKNSSLKSRLDGRLIGWGSGPPGNIKKEFDEARGARAGRVESSRHRSASEVRGRTPEEYVSSRYIGPLNPVPGKSPLEVARGWFERESRRRPQFKQTLQDIEHQGMTEHQERLRREIVEALKDNPYKIQPEDVLRDLFAPSRSPLQGYQKMVWVVANLDNGHWNKNPEEALEMTTADRFRKANPGAPIRVLMIDAPITHYGHIEKPRQVAGVLLEAVTWLGN